MGSSNMFKSLLATALVVAVKAEADPFYGYGYGLPYAHGVAYAGVPFGSSTGLDPITQGLDPVTQGALPVAHYYGKRSADAEADPYYLGGYAYGLPVGHPSGADPITQGLDASTQGYAPYAYGHLGYGYGHFGHYYGKRSADPYYLGGYAALPYAAHGVVAAAVPFGSSTGLDPITQGLDASTQGYAPFAHYGYGHHGLIYGKRSADADAYYGLIGYHGVPFGSSTGLDPI